MAKRFANVRNVAVVNKNNSICSVGFVKAFGFNILLIFLLLCLNSTKKEDMKLVSVRKRLKAFLHRMEMAMSKNG